MKTAITAILSAFMVAAIVRSEETPDGPTVVERGLTYLSSVQNADGSWGDGTRPICTSAFVVAAFLSYGETTASAPYGTNVTKGLKWLLRQTPTNELDRVSLLHALTAGYRMTKIPILGTEAQRHRAIIEEGDLSGSTEVLFNITMPPDAPSGFTSDTNQTLLHFTAASLAPASLDKYLESLAVFASGGPEWHEYEKRTRPTVLMAQAADGSFAPSDGQTRIESTTFSILRLTLYYRYWSDYLGVGM